MCGVEIPGIRDQGSKQGDGLQPNSKLYWTFLPFLLYLFLIATASNLRGLQSSTVVKYRVSPASCMVQ